MLLFWPKYELYGKLCLLIFNTKLIDLIDIEIRNKSRTLITLIDHSRRS